MSYAKLDLPWFKKSLKDGKYANVTNARRALAKVTGMTKADVEAARRAVDRHFKVETVKKTPVRKAAKRTASRAVKRTAK